MSQAQLHDRMRRPWSFRRCSKSQRHSSIDADRNVPSVIRPRQPGKNAHEDHQSHGHPHVGARADGEAAPHRPRHQGQERRDAHSRRDRQRAHRHRRGAREPADRRGHRRARAGGGGGRRGPDVLRAHLREDVQRLAQHAGARARRDAGRREPAPRRHHGGDLRRRHRRVGREGAGARHSALPGAGRGAPLGARLCQRRLGARRRGRGGAGGLRSQGLHGRQDARGRPRRLLHRQLRAPGEGSAPRARARTSS